MTLPLEPLSSCCRVAGRLVRLKPMEEAAEGETVMQYVCSRCGAVQMGIAKPTEADLERGRQLAEEYGW